MSENIKIRALELRQQRNGELKVLCSASDGSQWMCDVNGENWEKVTLSDDELTEKFNAAQQ